MIEVPIHQILFLDIETVGITSTYNDLQEKYPMLQKQFHNYFDWFLKRYPEDVNLPTEDVYHNRAALVPEFSKIVCVCMAFVDKEGKVRSQVLKNDDEYALLKEVNHLFERCSNLGFWMCGHNIKNFDIPVMMKRMMVNGIEPSKLLPRYDTKPWEVKAIDTLEVWRAGNPWGLASLELMCAAMGVESSKEGEVTGNRVHDAYWLDGMLDAIADYCERDVLVLVKIIDKLKNLR
jgi:predicted PolB exonuclease-like 3'-5' exonuclease